MKKIFKEKGQKELRVKETCNNLVISIWLSDFTFAISFSRTFQRLSAPYGAGP